MDQRPARIIQVPVVAAIALLAGCGTLPAIDPTATATPLPTLTPYPTYTPYPSPTAEPPVGLNQWVHGHFWSIKVVNVRTATELDGMRPTQDTFVLVEVDWKANDTPEHHDIRGVDFELVDDAGRPYTIRGMIFRAGDAEQPQGPGERYQDQSYRSTEVWGDGGDTYKLVYDVPETARGLQLWFQDLPRIDLSLPWHPAGFTG